jgi:hypothetical protein
MLDTTFLFAGKAIFTATNLAKGTRLTFKISKPDTDFRGEYFGSVMKGSDNESDYSYVGMVSEKLTLRATKGSKFRPGTPEFDGLAFVLDLIAGRKATDKLALAPASKCSRCGKTLTTPESIARGIGPECAGKAASPTDTKPVKKGRPGVVVGTGADGRPALIVPDAIVTAGPVPVVEAVWTPVPCTNEVRYTGLAALAAALEPRKPAVFPESDETAYPAPPPPPLAEDEADDNPETAGCMEAPTPVETDEARAKRVKADEDSADRADEYYSRILGF